MAEVDLEITEGDVLIKGHAAYGPCSPLVVHMTAPYDLHTEIHWGFFHRPPKTDEGFRLLAELRLRQMLAGKRRQECERNSMSPEAWAAEAHKAHRRLVAMNMKLQFLHEMIVGTAKEDLKHKKITQEEYVRLRNAYRQRARPDVEKVMRLIAFQRKARDYAAGRA